MKNINIFLLAILLKEIVLGKWDRTRAGSEQKSDKIHFIIISLSMMNGSPLAFLFVVCEQVVEQTKE